MIKEIKVLFVAMVAMMMLTGVASAAEIELTDLINIYNVNAVEITGTGFTPDTEFVYDIIANTKTVIGNGIVDSNGTILVTDINVSDLADGELLATVFEAGAVMATDTAIKDTVLPSFTIDEVTSPTNTDSQTVTGTIEDGATVEVTCSSSTAQVSDVTYPTNTTWSVEITDMSEGDNVITSTATDGAGNSASDTATILVDTVPPTITINTVDTPTNTDSQTVTGTMGDDWEGLEVKCLTANVSAVTATNTTWSVEITDMSEGDNVITAIAIDEVGNSASVNATIVLDTFAPVAPVITLLDPINITNVAAVTITGTGESGAGVEYLIKDFNGTHSADGEGMVAEDGSISVTGINVSNLDDGELTAQVWLTDAVGNKGEDGMDTATKDTVAPGAPVITLLDLINIANVAAVTITGSGEAGASIEFDIEDDDGGCIAGFGTVDGDGNISVTGINVSDLADGTLTASVWLTDAAGNNGAAGTAIATKDTVAPIADAGPDQIIILRDVVQFNGSGSYDPGNGDISYSWDFDDDSGISTDAEPSYEYEQYGTYTVTLTVTDNAGNTGTDTMTVTHGIKLNVGWNLVSTPLIPDNTSIEVVLSDVDDATIVWEYDADTSSWLSYIPGPNGPGGSLTEIAVGIGYWIDMSGDDTLVIEGTYLEEGANTPPTYPVYEGWNLIGVHSLDLRLAETYLSSTSFDCAHTLHGYQDSAWINIDLHSDYLEPGYGYWAYMTKDGAIAP